MDLNRGSESKFLSSSGSEFQSRGGKQLKALLAPPGMVMDSLECLEENLEFDMVFIGEPVELELGVVCVTVEMYIYGR